MSQSLFYWIIYSYNAFDTSVDYEYLDGLNPYFIGLSILIMKILKLAGGIALVSILILLDYLFLLLL